MCKAGLFDPSTLELRSLSSGDFWPSYNPPCPLSGNCGSRLFRHLHGHSFSRHLCNAPHLRFALDLRGRPGRLFRRYPVCHGFAFGRLLRLRNASLVFHRGHLTTLVRSVSVFGVSSAGIYFPRRAAHCICALVLSLLPRAPRYQQLSSDPEFCCVYGPVY